MQKKCPARVSKGCSSGGIAKHDDVVLELCYLNEAEVQDSCGHPEDGAMRARPRSRIARRERRRRTWEAVTTETMGVSPAA